MNTSISLGLACGALLLSASLWPASEDPSWPEILGPAEGTRPAPQEAVVWRSDLRAALAEARETERPLFVTLRCLPCKQCADFDKDVLEGGPRLDPLLKHFVTVRVTTAREVDLGLLPMEGFQDMDLSWWGWLLSPEARVYGVFGGKDHVSDATRISVDALENTLERVLEHHYDPRRSAWDVDGPAPDLSAAVRAPSDLPGYASWSKRGTEETDCLHCHQVAEILRQPALDAGTFHKRRDVAVWPLPENVGLVLERDDGLRVESVEPDSPAARAGLVAGDHLAAADGRRLFGQADFRGVLHRGPLDAGSIDVFWLRGDELGEGRLELVEGWRDTVLHWRLSISQGNIGAPPGIAWAHGASSGDRRKLGVPAGAMAIRPWFGKRNVGPAWDAGLRQGDLIVAVDGDSPNLVGREFMTWFRLRYDPGDTVTLTARDGRGRDRKIEYTLP